MSREQPTETRMGYADFLEKQAKAAEAEWAKLTPAQQRRESSAFCSPESVANMRAHAKRIRESV
jgi:hypothetical protein